MQFSLLLNEQDCIVSLLVFSVTENGALGKGQNNSVLKRRTFLEGKQVLACG